ncbi:hypothetical protein [Glycomyces dulcitolivorans]|uniref:hypothetical protein n=1 Tax=Glycomyces dulcitolivorans TaxID=2200759 RepID=UPI00130034CA|nr:hypothetical protein [Glycomyces dulcitolivorans]
MSCRDDSIRVTGERRETIDTRQLAHLLIAIADRKRDPSGPHPRQGVYRIDEAERADGR